MSRKTRHHAGPVTVARSPRSSAHRRRRRGIRQLRQPQAIVRSKAAVQRTNALTVLKTAATQAFSSLPTCIFLLGGAASLCMLGLIFALPIILKSSLFPYADAQWIVPFGIAATSSMGFIAFRAIINSTHVASLEGGSAALCSLVAGVAIAFIPQFLNVIQSANHWTHAHFILSDWLIYSLQLFLALVACFLPSVTFAIVAATLVTVHRKAIALERTTIALAAAITAGFLVALPLRASPDNLFLIGSLPLFLLALVAGIRPAIQEAPVQTAGA